ncbi:SDR family oxidoreductase [Sphingorhabdus sp.]|jgi:NAD(P)-dependent dehydrogenase (short-subunit alcohol dehydrogenase family)|uniref:SDR family oxidoreductase n=1 Tax=Sphingorhabdus sp. TaxID=1902408 RepID=UPI00378324DB
MRLENKVAVITGGAMGIGAATASRFIKEGCKVVIGDIQRGPGEAFAAQFGDQAAFAVCDVTKEDDVAALVDLAISRFGKLDIMFNNAGIVGAVGPIDTTPASEWNASLAVLINGVFFGMKHAARVMKPAECGSIISMASTAGLMGGLGPHAYAAGKHAVVGMTKNVAAELCHVGIRVNAIAAASMATPMVANVLTGDPSNIEEAKRILAEVSPLHGRPGLAEDVANAALWLASDESGYTTGHTLTTDAGTTIGATSAKPNFSEYQPMIGEAVMKTS